MSTRQLELNERLASRHLGRVTNAATIYRDVPVSEIQRGAIRTARAEARVLRTLALNAESELGASNASVKTLHWAADEAVLIIRDVMGCSDV